MRKEIRKDQEDPYRKAILDLYPPYAPTAEQLGNQQMHEADVNNGSRTGNQIKESQLLLDAVNAEIAEQEIAHNSRNHYERSNWLFSQPEHRDTIKHYQRTYAEISRSEREEMDNDGHMHEQFRVVGDMKALGWLAHKCLEMAGGITIISVEILRSQRMKVGETPLQAYTRMRLMATIIHDFKFQGFLLEHELTMLLTVKELRGGAFFTNTLHELAHNDVSNGISMAEHNKGSPLTVFEELDIWVTLTQKKYMHLHSRDPEALRKVHHEAANRSANDGSMGVYKPNLTEAQAWNPPKAPAATPAAAAPKAKAKTGGCHIHGPGAGHTTEQCQAFKNIIEERANALLAAGARTPRALTTLPAPGADPNAKGVHPGRPYAANQAPAQPSRADANAGPPNYPRCERCFRVTNRDYFHRPENCQLDPKTRIIAGFNVPDKPRRDIINEKRKKQDMPPLEPFVYKPRVGVALAQPAANHTPDPDNRLIIADPVNPRVTLARNIPAPASTADPSGARCMVTIAAGQRTTDPNAPVTDQQIRDGCTAI